MEMNALINRGFQQDLRQHSAANALEALAALPMPAHRNSAMPKLVRTAKEESEDPGARNWMIEEGGNLHTGHSTRLTLESASLSAPSLRHRGRGLVIQLRGSCYRARFSHLRRQEAIRACSSLKLKKYTCRILSHPTVQIRQEAAYVDASTAGQEN
jgi:hypothetical protein